MTNSSSLIRVLILVIAAFISIYMGMLVVTSQIEALFWIGLASILILCVWLGRDIWLLIPATMSLRLMFPWLPGGFPPDRIAILLVLGWCLLLVAMRKLPLRFKFTHVEFTALLVLATIFQGYVRNPVGLAAMGSDSVGAKPYAMIIITTMGGILLASLIVTPDRIRKTMLVMLAGAIFSTTINLLAYFSSAIAAITGPTLGAFGKGNPFRDNGQNFGPVDETAANRISVAGELSNLLSRWVSANRNPLRALANPLWGTLVLVALAAAGMTGYRNALAITGLTLGLGTYYWGRIGSVLPAVIMAAIAYLLLVLINPIAPLPPNVQRTLTALPGPWAQKYKDDAKASTEWRTQMWVLALTTDRYIQNKIFGDGLGITKKEYHFLNSLGKDTVGLSNEMSQERAMATQSYHSGPVQTIRVTGYVGLAVLLYALFVTAVHAHRLIIRTRGTEWFVVVMFLVLHMVWHPIFFIFVFGSFGDDVPTLFLNMGILRLLENNLPLPLRNTSSTMLARPVWLDPSKRGLPSEHSS